MSQTTKLIVGLGNPGAEYENTRHNAGCWLLDALARQYGVTLSPESKFHGLAARARVSGGDVWLLQPMTFMNRSGGSIAALASFYKIAPADIIVLHDELDIPVGTAKIKIGGSTGGHNGLKDTQAKLGTDQFWRLRIGIDHPRHSSIPLQPVADYVLRAPKSNERELIDKAIDKAQDMMPDWLAGNFEKAMRELHQK
ncbi:MAG: aminoacyl-tRNA hydrolase [Formosimonas sp.]|jgi:PTH1 family peptidyl-tRNA hydrolase